MKVEDIKGTIFKKMFKSIPNWMMALCASYALFMGTNIIVLKFSDIDANQHISRYLDISLNAKENPNKLNKDIELRFIELEKRVKENKTQIESNTELAHKGQ